MKTKIEGITLSDKFPSSALVGNIDASYKELEALLGPPNGEASGDGKVSTEWVLGHNGQVFSLYDYKETSLYDSELPSVEAFRAQPSYCWHIGGHVVGIEGHRAREGFVECLQKAFRALREKTRQEPEPLRARLGTFDYSVVEYRRFGETLREKAGEDAGLRWLNTLGKEGWMLIERETRHAGVHFDIPEESQHHIDLPGGGCWCYTRRQSTSEMFRFVEVSGLFMRKMPA